MVLIFKEKRWDNQMFWYYKFVYLSKGNEYM